MAKTVSELCDEKKIGVDELIRRSGLDRSRVEAIVLGRWTPSPDERRRIADVFGVQPPDVAWGHKTPIQHLYGHGPG